MKIRILDGQTFGRDCGVDYCSARTDDNVRVVSAHSIGGTFGESTMSKQKIPQKLVPWLEAKKRHRLSDVQVQRRSELGMNPKKLGKLDNHKQEPWKLPLPQFIEKCYLKTFKRAGPRKPFRWAARLARRPPRQSRQRQTKHRRSRGKATLRPSRRWT